MRRMLASGLAIALSVIGLAVTAPAAGAAPGDQVVWIDPVTWVAGGYQYVATGRSADPGNAVAVTRTPDDGWGRRIVAFTPPASGLAMELVVAANDAGILSTTWRSTGCAATVCDRWFARYDVTGAVVGTPTLVPDAPKPWRPLNDGSFLTRDEIGTLGWRGPDGTDRTALPQATSTVRAAAVDTAGRLLITWNGPSMSRWPVGGPGIGSLAIVTGCPAGAASAIGPAPDGGFAVACEQGSPRALTVTRYTPAGEVAWQSVGTARAGQACCREPIPFDTPTHLVVDGLDRVWVAGQMGGATFGPGALIESFTSAGPGPVADFQPDQMHGPTHRYEDLRLASSDHVAFASVTSCCVSLEQPWNTNETVGSGIVPGPPGTPLCEVGLTVGALDEASLAGTVLPCDLPSIGREPTGYRVEARAVDGTLLGTDEVGPGSGTTPEPFAIATAAGGRVTHLEVVAVNSYGDGSSSGQTTTVPPFHTLDGFIDRVYLDLTPDGAPGSVLNNDLLSGSKTPRSVVVDLLQTGYARDDVEPVARLYRAFFLRDADPSGIDYWSRRHRNGQSLSRIAGQFAASSEFQRRYGKLSNAAFVAQLYKNVFGRSADPSGAAFWTKRLDAKRASRGSVVLGFSESSESVRRSAPLVQPLAASFLLLRRLPTDAERAAWAGAADPRAAAVADILGSAGYAERIAALGG